MNFTDYGKALAKTEAVPAPHPLGGATAHMHACQYDAENGTRILLTGEDYNGGRIRREAKSLYGAFAQAHAMSGIRRGWHLLPDGTRRLVFSR